MERNGLFNIYVIRLFKVREVAASGFRIFTPEIPDVGKVRIRYPVMPFHNEGSGIHKNLVALQDIMMDMKKFTDMFEERPEVSDAVWTIFISHCILV